MVERVYGFTVSVYVCDKMVQDYQTRLLERLKSPKCMTLHNG